MVAQSTHPMTLRSKKQQPKIKKSNNTPKVHPKSWKSHTHYGQCGQSCPCCRAILGDEWGACSICIH